MVTISLATVTVQTAEQSVSMSTVCHASCHFYPPFERVLALGTEEVDVVFELQFEDVIFVNPVPFSRSGHRVPEQRQTG